MAWWKRKPKHSHVGCRVLYDPGAMRINQMAGYRDQSGELLREATVVEETDHAYRVTGLDDWIQTFRVMEYICKKGAHRGQDI